MDIKVLDHIIVLLINGRSEAFSYLCEKWHSMLKILEEI